MYFAGQDFSNLLFHKPGAASPRGRWGETGVLSRVICGARVCAGSDAGAEATMTITVPPTAGAAGIADYFGVAGDLREAGGLAVSIRGDSSFSRILYAKMVRQAAGAVRQGTY